MGQPTDREMLEELRRCNTPAITDVVATYPEHPLLHQQGIIITTSDFSKAAQSEALAPNKTHICLINGEELEGLLVRHKVVVRERSLPVLGLDEEYWGELIGQAGETRDTDLTNAMMSPRRLC